MLQPHCFPIPDASAAEASSSLLRVVDSPPSSSRTPTIPPFSISIGNTAADDDGNVQIPAAELPEAARLRAVENSIERKRLLLSSQKALLPSLLSEKEASEQDDDSILTVVGDALISDDEKHGNQKPSFGQNNKIIKRRRRREEERREDVAASSNTADSEAEGDGGITTTKSEGGGGALSLEETMVYTVVQDADCMKMKVCNYLPR